MGYTVGKFQGKRITSGDFIRIDDIRDIKSAIPGTDLVPCYYVKDGYLYRGGVLNTEPPYIGRTMLGGLDPAALQKKLENLNARIRVFIPKAKRELNEASLFYNSTAKHVPENRMLAKQLSKLANEMLSEANFALPAPSFFEYGSGWVEISKWPLIAEWMALEKEKNSLTSQISGEVKTKTTTADKVKKYAVPAAIAATAGAGLWLLFKGGGGLAGVGLMGNPVPRAPSLPKSSTARQKASFKKRARMWFSDIVREQARSGKPQPQSVAIAYSYARRQMKPHELRLMGWRS